MRIQLGAISSREPTESPHPNEPERLITGTAVRRGIADTAVDESDEWDFARARRVADRRLAAARVPPEHPRSGEAHASQLSRALGDLETTRPHLKDVGATVRVEDLVGPFEEMREGLTIVAIADTSIGRLTGHSPQHAS